MQIIKDIPEFRREPLLVLVFGFITCGIYLIFWNAKAARVFNALADREIISPTLAGLCGCIYPLNVYFYYVVAQDGIPKLNEYIGAQDKDYSILYLLLGIFFPMITAMIMQSEINKVFDRRD